MQEYVSDKKGTPITFTIARQGAIINKTVVPGDDGLIGVGLDVQPQRTAPVRSAPASERKRKSTRS